MNLLTIELSRDRKSSRFAATPGAPSLLSAQEQLGFELGWDYAHHGATPPGACAQEDTSLRAGLLAGRAAFGARTLPATHSVQLWLQLRLSAWLRGRCVEAIQITPRYLEQLETGQARSHGSRFSPPACSRTTPPSPACATMQATRPAIWRS